jgi:hypothetical protein
MTTSFLLIKIAPVVRGGKWLAKCARSSTELSGDIGLRRLRRLNALVDHGEGALARQLLVYSPRSSAPATPTNASDRGYSLSAGNRARLGRKHYHFIVTELLKLRGRIGCLFVAFDV